MYKIMMRGQYKYHVRLWLRNFSQFMQTLSGIGSKSSTFKSHCRYELAKIKEIYLKD